MLFHKRHPPVGVRPGTLVIPETVAKPHSHVMSYTAATLEESDVAQVSGFLRRGWIGDRETDE